MAQSTPMIRTTVWDLEAIDGPVELEMWTVDAREALENDPKRYVGKLPKGVRPGPADAAAKAARAARDADVPVDPHYGAPA